MKEMKNSIVISSNLQVIIRVMIMTHIVLPVDRNQNLNFRNSFVSSLSVQKSLLQLPIFFRQDRAILILEIAISDRISLVRVSASISQKMGAKMACFRPSNRKSKT